MTDLQAIQRRISRRSYLSTPIDAEKARALTALASECNAQSGLHIQLVEDGSTAFASLAKSYGMFSGVRSLFAMVAGGQDSDRLEKVGYFGERLVLSATALELGTCWVAGTFDAKSCPCAISGDETLVCVITVGNVSPDTSFKEKTIYRLAHRSTKGIEQLYTADATPPDWFINGVKAVQRAPSAINRQPVRLSYSDGSARIAVDTPDGVTLIDLGIAKLHFELAAGGRFAPGNNALFTKNQGTAE